MLDFPWTKRLRGSDIRAIRRALGQTQASFAQCVGVSRVTVALWESGRSEPARKHSPRIADLARRIKGDDAASTEVFGVEEIAVYLRISAKTVYRAIRSGKMCAARTPDGIWRVRRVSGLEFMAQRYKRPARESATSTAFASAVPDDYAQRIRDLRRELRWTQDELGAFLGIPRGRRYVSKWEIGLRRPKPTTWAKIMGLKKIGA